MAAARDSAERITLDLRLRQASQAALLAVRLGIWGLGDESGLFCCPPLAGSNGRSERDISSIQ